MKSLSLFALILLIAATTASASEPNPSDLVLQAHAVVAKHSDYKKSISLLQKANTIWQKNDVKSPEYLASLTYLATLYLAEDRRSSAALGISKDNGIIYSQWKSQSSSLLSQALTLSRALPAVEPASLALALELQCLMAGNKDTGGGPWTQATAIRSTRVSEILPALDLPANVLAVGMGVTSPTLLNKTEPTYSPEAQILQITGIVHLSVVIETDGTPSSAQLIEGIGFGLDEQAAQAVKGWRFNPGVKDGNSVRVRARVDVDFKLQ